MEKKICSSKHQTQEECFYRKDFSFWANKIEILDKIADPYAKYWSTGNYLEDLIAETREFLTAGIDLYSLQPLLEIGSRFCRADKEETGY